MRGITNSIQTYPISCAITTQPTTTSFTEGDALDTSGIVVKATMNNGVQKQVTNLSYSVPSGNISSLATTDTTVTVTAVYKGKTFTLTYAITVANAYTLTITGSGFSTSTCCSVTYNGTTYKDATTIRVVENSTINCKVYARGTSNTARIWLNDTQVTTTSGGKSTTYYTSYDFVATSNATINMSSTYISSNSYYGTVKITTS